MAQLVHLRSNRRHLLPAEFLVGRRGDCDLRVDASSTSTVHAMLRWEGRRWTVHDLGSRNGTFVNGHRISAITPLHTHDTLGFGDPSDPWRLTSSASPAVPVRPRRCTPTVHGLMATLAACSVVFRVSHDHEHIELVVEHAGRIEHIPSVSANEPLLVLAQARLEDQALPASEQGWLALDALMSRCRLNPRRERERITIRNWVRTSRRRFERLGFVDGARIVERRHRQGPVRLGVGRFTIELPASHHAKRNDSNPLQDHLLDIPRP